jgi:beta-glucosidase
MVLLKNEGGLLPLPKDRPIALFGAGAGRTVKGGTGSGDVNERASVSIAQGLREAGYPLTTEKWLADYEKAYTDAREAWKQAILAEREELEEKGVLSAFFAAYSHHQFTLPAGPAVYGSEADTALYVLSRVAGENADRKPVAGDYYLSGEERQQLTDLCRLYPKVVLILNTGGVVDLSILDELPGIQAVLFVSQPGMEGGRAVADVLSGAVCPSGRLTDTWAKRYEDYPSAAAFSRHGEDRSKSVYEEGIYVGYRYFDSFQVPVRYGFGFGLSYAAFTIEAPTLSLGPDGVVTVQVSVTNAGSVSGRQVVQVYAGLPAGRLEKESRRLAAFGKTRALGPGETEVLTLTFSPQELASYDEENAQWLLEKEVYGVYVGPSLAESRLVGSLKLDADKVLVKTEHICPPKQEIHCLSLPKDRRQARYEAMVAQAESLPQLNYDLASLPTQVVDYDDREAEDEASRLVETLTEEQLVALATGDPGKGQEADASGALGAAAVSVPGAAAETSDAALSQGVASLALADGPAGLRLTQRYQVKDGVPQHVPMELNLEHGVFFDGKEPEGETYYQYCTAFPVGTLLAQSWDVHLLEEMGSAVGEEMEEFGVQLWLAPGMNLHRNPLCGRNFEYFAEDPLLTGRCAGAITRGVQRHPGLGVTIKHFACNSQEDDRMSRDSVLTERTLRELYLRGFQIAIREGDPWSIMTSYNFVNGVHAANNYDLCTKAARREFGFHGVIMTDWTTTNVDDVCTASGCIRAGNDLVMPGMAEDHDDIRKALSDGSLSLTQLRRCVTHLVRVVLRSDRYI